MFSVWDYDLYHSASMFDFEQNDDDTHREVKMYHKTKAGVKIPIPSMEDKHLVNTIRLKLERIKDYQVAIKAQVPKNLAFMYNAYQENNEDVSLQLARDTEALFPYIFYACLRPTICDEVLVLLQETFNDKDTENDTIY